jgi:mono/diheme cytochrome c family protein
MSHTEHKVEEHRPPQLHAVVAEFSTPNSLVEAARQVQEAGYKNYECYSPHPVHGIDKAMKTPYSPIPWLVLGGGLTGLLGANLMQGWMNGWDYPYLISGKPFFSVPAWMPVNFELTILLSGITAFVGMIGLNKLFQYYSPLNKSKVMTRVTNDKYALVVEANDPNFRLDATSNLLTAAGAKQVEVCYEEYQKEDPPTILWQIIILLVAFGLIPMALVFKSSFTVSDAEPLRIDHGMAFQQKQKGQNPAPAGVLPQNLGTLSPIEGTIQFGTTEDEHFNKGKVNGQFVNGFPAKIKDKLDDAMMARGQRQFTIYCSVCHGPAGYGDGMVHQVATQRAASGDLSLWVPPKSFHDPLIASKPDGELFDTITWGKNKMWGYGYRLTPEDRWAIVLYVRALQKSQTGKTTAGEATTRTTASN